ncbi:MAG: PaaI family thioesterase [Candidatus Dormibacteraeota bacterium]|nr:PaaI family thioesterase [Candidatus Dormibacteraeota bacterium]
MTDLDAEIDPAWLNDRSAYQMNYVHGLRNPTGLHLQFVLDGERAVTEWTPGPEHGGFPGVAHGGLVVAAIDDAMARCAAVRHRWVVTGRLDVRFRSAAPIGEPLRIEAWSERLLRRVMHAAGRAVLPDGTVVAEARGTYLPIPGDLRRRMLEAWPGFAEFI